MPDDKVPLITMGYGRTDATDGRVFPWVFPLMVNYWSLSTAKIKFIGSLEGGMDNLKGLKIAIMGCIVNGPGEMADADYGYVGTGYKKVSLYKKHNVIKKNIDSNKAVNALIQLIKDNGDWIIP